MIIGFPLRCIIIIIESGVMEKMTLQKDFYLLQVNDALFPIGGYSHSQGLETYIQKGIVHDEVSAAQYIRQKLCWNLTHTELLAARLAWEYADQEDIQRLNELEEILEASRLPMEQREASRKMGSRFAKTMGALQLPENGSFRKYTAARKGKTMSHCCVYGVFCAALSIEKRQALSHFLYAQISAAVTNCVKTIPLSQSSGQKLLSECYPLMAEELERVEHLTVEDLCLSAPGFDLRGMQHERLYSRIYMS